MPTRRILHIRATPHATPATGVKQTLSTQCTRKTYPTSGNSFPTLKDMIGNMGLLFCLFVKSITNSSSLQSSFISSHDYFIS